MPEAFNLSQQSPLLFTKISYSHLCLASLSLRSAVAKTDAAYFSAAEGRREVSGIRLGDRLIR